LFSIRGPDTSLPVIGLTLSVSKISLMHFNFHSEKVKFLSFKNFIAVLISKFDQFNPNEIGCLLL